MNHIIIITGLGSSIPFIGRIWTAWARKLEDRFNAHFKGRKDITIKRVSADGNGEAKALNQLRRDKTNGTLGKIAIIAHSNGFRDGLNMAASIRNSPVDFFAGIDMTLGEFGALAYGNIKLFHEYHAQLAYANFHHTFDKSNHHIWEIRKGHTAAASDLFVQNNIFGNVVNVME